MDDYKKQIRIITSKKDSEIFFDAISNPKSPNKALTKAALSLHNVVGQSEQCCSNSKHKTEVNEMFENWVECKNCGKEII